MKLVCIGDSLTYGYGVPRRDTWVTLTAQRTGIELVNAGVNGDTSGGMLARFHADVLAQHPGAVFLMGGVNDMMSGCPGFVPQSNVMGMVHQAAHNGIPVLIGVPLPFWWEGLREDWADFASGLKRESMDEYRAWLLSFGESFGLPVVDFQPPFLQRMRSGEGDSCYLDGIHPNGLGHQLMTQTMCDALERLGLWHSSGE